MFLLEHACDVLVLIRKDTDQLLVLRAETVEESLIKDTHQFIRLLQVLRSTCLQPIGIGLLHSEVLRTLHDLADLEEFRTIDPS